MPPRPKYPPGYRPRRPISIEKESRLRPVHSVLRILSAMLAVYLVMLAALYFFQDRLLYLPTHDIQPPAAYGLPELRERTVTEADGTRLQLWTAPARPGQPTVIYFHGNGGHLGHRARVFRALLDAGFGLVALDWRGFGASGGTPSEAGILADARAGIAFAREGLGIPPRMLVLYGESLGTGVAVRMAAEMSEAGHPPRLTVLQSPYQSVAMRAGEMYSYVPVRLLLRDAFESIGRLPKVRSPLLILHGEEDQVIPISHGRAMFAAANAPKKAVYFPHVAHTGFPMGKVITAMRVMLSPVETPQHTKSTPKRKAER